MWIKSEKKVIGWAIVIILALALALSMGWLDELLPTAHGQELSNRQIPKPAAWVQMPRQPLYFRARIWYASSFEAQKAKEEGWLDPRAVVNVNPDGDGAYVWASGVNPHVLAALQARLPWLFELIPINCETGNCDAVVASTSNNVLLIDFWYTGAAGQPDFRPGLLANQQVARDQVKAVQRGAIIANVMCRFGFCGLADIPYVIGQGQAAKIGERYQEVTAVQNINLQFHLKGFAFRFGWPGQQKVMLRQLPVGIKHDYSYILKQGWYLDQSGRALPDSNGPVFNGYPCAQDNRQGETKAGMCSTENTAGMMNRNLGRDYIASAAGPYVMELVLEAIIAKFQLQSRSN